MPDKPKVGLPEGFSLNVDEPVELGDYLDEMDAKPPPPPAPRVAKKGALPVKETTAVAGESAKERRAQNYGKRKQLNLRREEWRRLEELVEHVRDYGVQADTAASEVLGALISVAHEARSHLVLSGVPARGRWGSPSAKVFRDALSLALAESVVSARSSSALDDVGGLAAVGEG